MPDNIVEAPKRVQCLEASDFEILCRGALHEELDVMHMADDSGDCPYRPMGPGARAFMQLGSFSCFALGGQAGALIYMPPGTWT